MLSGIVAGVPVTVAQLAAEIEWAKARLVGPDDYAGAAAAARRRPPAAAERVADLYRRYEDDKRRARMVDFDDLLRLCSHLVETEPAFAAAQRWRFQHLFVDEFQDVNPLQLRLLDAWRGDSYDLCVVGDPHQAIYGWNGADAGFLSGFRRLYPPAEVIALDGNYRSTPEILAAAADVLGRAGAGEPTVVATRVEGPAVRLERHASEHDEARAIARAVRDRHGPRAAWSAQAVLVRTHAQVPVLTDALRMTGVPHHVKGADGMLDRREVRSALDMLRRGEPTLAACLPDLVTAAAEAEGEAAADLGVVAAMARDHLRLDPRATAPGFVSWLVATLQAESGDTRRDAVTVATFHAAKGLEWPVVHLAGLEDGLVPITHARTQAQRAEEARLLYVAMTRAEDELRCSWAAQRSFGGTPTERRLTPWLTGLAERQRDRPDDGAAPSPQWRRHLAEQRAALAGARAGAAGGAGAAGRPARVAGGAGPGRPGRARVRHRRPPAGGDRGPDAGDAGRAGGRPRHGPAAGGPGGRRPARRPAPVPAGELRGGRWTSCSTRCSRPAGTPWPGPTPAPSCTSTSWGCRSCRRPTSSTTGSTAPPSACSSATSSSATCRPRSRPSSIRTS